MYPAKSQTVVATERKRYVFHFEGFTLSTSPLQLRRDGLTVEVRQQAIRLLQLLLQRIGEPVTFEEIGDHLWPLSTDTDSATAIRIAVLHARRALGDRARQPRYIETVTGIGYRFIHPVQVEEAPLMTVYRVR